MADGAYVYGLCFYLSRWSAYALPSSGLAMRQLYGKCDMAIYDMEGNRYSVEGYTMPQCRESLLAWINNTQRDSSANWAMRHWLNALGGLGASW